MAEANWLRKPPAPNLDDDPFEELTRIMGFDPRVPFRGTRQEAPQQVAAAPKVEVSDEDLDFSLDLENELIGALEPELESMAAAAGPAPRQAASWTAVQADPYPIRAVATPAPQVPALDEEAYGAAQATGNEDESLASGDAQEWDADAAAFADYVAEDDETADDTRSNGSVYAESPRYDDAAEDPAQTDDLTDSDQNEAPHYAAYRRADGDDGQPDAQHAGWNTGPDASVAAEASPAYADHDGALAAELDEVLSASLDDDAAYGDDWLADHEPGSEAPRQADEDMRPFAPLPVDHFATGFDEAMAEVDMDFTATEPALPEAAWRAPQHDPADLEDASEDLPSRGADLLAQDGDEETDDGEFLSADPEDDAHGVADDALESYAVEDEPLEDVAAGSPVSHEPVGHDDDASHPDAYSVTQHEIDDAIAELAAMVRGYDQPRPAAHEAADEAEPESATADAVDVLDIDTVDVPEGAVALADDLDIPDIDYTEDTAPVFDDLDAELAAAFGEPAMETVQPAQPKTSAQQDFDLDGGYDDDASGSGGFGAAAFAGAAAAGAAGAYQAATLRGRPGDVQFVRRDTAGAYAQDDFEVEADPELEDDDDPAAAASMGALRRSPARRGLVVASVVGGIALVGVIGALAFTGGGAIGSGEPALVKADSDPVKVRPENPGGTVVANQTSGVFDRAAGEAPVQPEQPALISTEEEPVDVAARFPDPEPIDESADIEALAEAPAKSEDRIEPAAAEMAPAQEDTLAVPPRKVRTMIVRSDGTLVPREEVVTEQPATVGSTTAAGSLTDPAISASEARDDFSAAAEAPAAEAPATAAADDAATAGTQPEPAPAATRSAMPDQVPLAPSRPADQPLDIVGEVKPGQVASLDPQAGAVPAGTWSMQIASQPTEAAAQASYKDLSRRYASVLGGRSANIVKAEIAGKGTFWRVRVPAGSRNEAVQLCESYKAAGGNCFVSK